MSEPQIIKDIMDMLSDRPKPTDTVEESIRKMERIIKEERHE